MLKGIIRVFIRSLIKNPGYSFLHIAGLAIGLASFVFIALYVNDELSYDRYHSKADRIYRLNQNFESEGLGEKAASLPFPILEPLLNDYKNELESYCRFFNFQAPFLTLATVDGMKSFNESRVFFADSTLFEVFDFELLQGEKHSSLKDANTMLITKSMADKYFPNEDPIGKTLKLQQKADVLITGVISDTPSNSHFTFDFLVSFTTIKEFYASGNYPTNWSWNPVWTYLALKKDVPVEKIQQRFPEFVTKNYPEAYHKSVTLSLIPLTDIHLHSAFDYEISPNNSIKTIYILAAIGLVVLIIASINFINLSTARSATRALEVGMRKTLGSKYKQLVVQFLMESVMVTLISFGLAITIVLTLLPSFNALTEKQISPLFLLSPEWILLTIFLPLVLGTLAGLYPAFVLSSAKPLTILTRTSSSISSGSFLRKSLVIFQFSLSIVLVIGTGVIFDQLALLREGQTGFDQENVILIPVMRTGMTNAGFETLKDELLKNPRVLGVSAVEDIVGSKHQVYSYKFEGLETVKPFPALQIRHGFTKTFNVKLVAGRDYDETFLRDDSASLVVNESLVKAMGWSNEEAIGKRFDDNADHRIVGVVQDFNFTSRHSAVRPLVLDLVMHPASFSVFIKYLAIRISPDQRQNTLDHLKNTWATVRDGWPFEYFFLEQNLKNLYKAEEKLSSVTMIFSTLSILVGCLGLFGLATYSAHQRSREMSIRKVLGGSSNDIFALFCRGFVREILIAVMIAVPVSWMIMNYWLSGFSYRAGISAKWLIAGPLAAILIALATVTYHALRLSNSNPAKVLKDQ